MAKQKDAKDRLRRARSAIEAAESERVAAIHVAKAARVPAQEIAELLGFKNRRSAYQLVERHEKTPPPPKRRRGKKKPESTRTEPGRRSIPSNRDWRPSG